MAVVEAIHQTVRHRQGRGVDLERCSSRGQMQATGGGGGPLHPLHHSLLSRSDALHTLPTQHTCTRCKEKKETRPLAQSSMVEGSFQRCGREAAQRLSVHRRSVSHGHRFRSRGRVSAGVRNRGERTLEEHTSPASSRKHNSLRWRGGDTLLIASPLRTSPPPPTNTSATPVRGVQVPMVWLTAIRVSRYTHKMCR